MCQSGCGEPLPRQLSPGVGKRRCGDRVPLSFIAASNTGIATGKDLTTTARRSRSGRRAMETTHSGSAPFRGSSGGRLLEVPDRPRGSAHLPALPLEGHAGQPDPDPVLLARRGGDPSALVEEPLGHPDRIGRRTCTSSSPSDAARLRWTGGPQRPPEFRRDPLLGRLHHSRQVRLHLRRRGRSRRPEPGELFVIAGDQNSDPLDGDSIPGAIQQLLDHPLVNAKSPRTARRGQAAALQGART